MTYEELRKKYPTQEINESLKVWMHSKSTQGEHVPLGWMIGLVYPYDEWTIGYIENAKVFMNDLQQAITFIENNPIENE